MTSDLRDILSYNLQSAFGRKVNKNFVIFESDDWGSVSIPSPQAYNRLARSGLPVQDNHFNKFDNLATKADIGALIDVLSKFHDHKGKNPIFTINVTTGNPDFKAIKESGFTEFHFEPFFKTIEKKQPEATKVWNDAIEQKLFFPQYHGRDHIHMERWMNALKANDYFMHKAFEEEAIGIKPMNDSPEYYMAAYDYSIGNSNVSKQLESIDQGLEIFKDFFGFLPKSFIPPCYICNREILEHLGNVGVVGLQGKIIHLLPNGLINGKRSYKKMYRLPGHQSKTGVTNLVRNVFFEPSSNQSFDWVSNALKRTEIAFQWGNPAIISSHRVNYIGSHNERNRSINLIKLTSLIKAIINHWPNVEFISSQELIKYYLPIERDESSFYFK